ncbi:YtxH domain-containing protein [Paenibacillus sp.]|jgi:gas vesicle protein|uniref:YtxH domain-containing protein n=1 Tax=Paenibacillus sp. TaxID=58172 RepID=UPI002826A21E|nr:YtxH domain-containing protein [Paenibacillus sp.]MDR0270941.1 YtxH domain-containing protein [Paenibacillus sp.]
MDTTETEYQAQSSKTFLKGALIGGLIGAAAALLFAPKPGRELRGDLSEKISTVSDKSKELATTVGEKATDLAKSVTSKTTELSRSIGQGKKSFVISATQATASVEPVEPVESVGSVGPVESVGSVESEEISSPIETETR